MKEINSERQALNEAFENVDDRFIEKTKDAPRVRKWGSFSPRAVIAACLAILLIGGAALFAIKHFLGSDTPHGLPPVTGDETDYETVYEELRAKMAAILQEISDGAPIPEIDEGTDGITALTYRIAKSEGHPPTVGYSVKDLNGDGTPEFAVVNEAYQILALITAKGEDALILRDFSGDCTVNVDGNGIIYTHEYIYEELEYMIGVTGEEYCIYELRGSELVTTLLIGAHQDQASGIITYYLVEDGQRREVELEEWKEKRQTYRDRTALFDGYCEGELLRIDGTVEFNRFIEAAPRELKESRWLCSELIGRFELQVTEITESGAVMEITESFVGDTIITLNTLRDGERYTFESEELTGYAEFGSNYVWVTVTESSVEGITPRMYLLKLYPF